MMFGLPPIAAERTTIFTSCGGSSATGNWQPYIKPRGASMYSIFCLGSGGGGGAGFTGAAGTARGGGGGGSSGACTRLIIPVVFLPDVIYVNVGRGAAAGNVGPASFVSTEAYQTATGYLVTVSGSGGANNGGAGTGSAGGSGGSAAIASVASDAMGHGYGTFNALGGRAGTAGGAHTGAAGANTAWGSGGIFVTGGAGGGGTPTANTDFAGGEISNGGKVPTLSGGIAAAGAGQSGFEFRPPFLFASTGGSGGGTAGAAGTAGSGGAGGVGSGGGGGGGGVTGGAGGRGGDGLVIITWW